MAFLDDMRDLIVNDASIADRYGNRIYFQLLPGEICKEDKWMRWGFTKASDTVCMGGGTAFTTYNVFFDLISKNINELPVMGDEIIENLNNSTFNGIRNLIYQTDVYSNYEEKELYVHSLNFIAQYK
jgi:hypothetical protein